MRRKKFWNMTRKDKLTGLVFIAPFVAGFLFFYLRGLIMSVRFAMSSVGLSDSGYTLKGVGFDNFVAAFRKEVAFPQTLASSFLNMFLDVALIIFFALFIAVLLNAKFKGRGLARSIFFLPVALNGEAIAGALNNARNLLTGGADAMGQAAANPGISAGYYLGLLTEIGVPIGFINYIVGVVSRIADVITSSGVQIVIFIAALQAISPALYEVAKIEGATAYETFWKVTFPLVSPLILTNFVYTCVDAYTKSPVVRLSYDTIFGYRADYAMGTAFSLISLVIVCAFLGAAGAVISRLVYYQN